MRKSVNAFATTTTPRSYRSTEKHGPVSAFIFSDKEQPAVAHRAELPVEIEGKPALMRALSVALRFPDYFGGNWDALEECIRDLSWLPAGCVVLLHKDLPLAEDQPSLSTYLSILHGAVESWNRMGSNLLSASPEGADGSGGDRLLARRELLVVFPPSARTAVRRMLASARRSGGSAGPFQS